MLTEKQILHILKNKLISKCNKEQKKQIFNYAFGSDFMKSNNKGKKIIYNQSK